MAIAFQNKGLNFTEKKIFIWPKEMCNCKLFLLYVDVLTSLGEKIFLLNTNTTEGKTNSPEQYKYHVPCCIETERHHVQGMEMKM